MKPGTFIKTSFIVFTFLCLSLLVKAQLPGDGGNDPDPGQGAPLDLGITALVAAGIGYAAKRRYDAKKKENKTDKKEK